MIKQLQEQMDDMATFVHCLTMLIFMEKPPLMTPALLDLYVYYCVIGISMPSPTLRAASIAMLSVVLAHNMDLVTDMLPRLSVMAKEEVWWEVQAQLLVICHGLLDQLPPNNDDALSVLGIVRTILNPDASYNIRKVGLSYLASNLQRHPSLLPVYVEVLLTMSARRSQNFVLSINPDHAEELPVAGASGGKYRLQPLPLTPDWPGLLIAQQLVTDVAVKQPEHMEPEQMQALLGCLTSPKGSSPFADGMDEWIELFQKVRDYIFVALCDSDCVDLALQILRKFILESDLREAVLKEGTLLGSLRLLYPLEGGADQQCQEDVAEFLKEMYEEGHPYSKAIEMLLEQFVHNHSQQFESSPLAPLRMRMMEKGGNYK